MEEEQTRVPMDIDSEDSCVAEETDIPTITTEEENASYQIVVSWLLESRGKTRVRDLKPWDGFISPRKFCKLKRSTYQHTETFRLSELKNHNKPMQISVAMCLNQSQKKKDQINSDDDYYLFHLKALRWNNSSGIDLACKLSNVPNVVTPMMKRVVKNFPNAIYGTFMVINNGSTHETCVRGEGKVADGVALAERDFGMINSKFLRDFGCIEERHLARGCIEIPKNVVEQANLDNIFLKLRKTTFVHSLHKEEMRNGDNDDNGDIAIDTNRFFLVPCTSLLAWPYIPMDASERAKWGIYVVQIRSFNKNTGQVTEPYWIVDYKSFVSMIQFCNEKLIKSVNPMTLDDIGVTLYPIKNAKTWDDPMIIEELTPLMSQEETEKVYDKSRSLYIKFVSGVVSFPRSLKEEKNLAPIVHPDFYDFRQFKSSGVTRIPQQPQDTTQRKKIK